MRSPGFGSLVLLLLLVGTARANPTSTGSSLSASNDSAQFNIVRTNNVNARDEITDLTDIVGNTRVFLNGDSQVCRREECNLGNLITDALVDYNAYQYNGSDGWTDAAIAVINSGNIRSSISTSNANQISRADVLAVLPFDDVAIIVSMTGEQILSMLQWSVYNLTQDATEDLNGAFLQYSGIQVTYDLSKPSGSKVVSVKVRCASCRVPLLRDLDATATYSVILTDYLYTGGDDYTVFSGLSYRTLGVTVADIVVDYLGRRSPVYPSVQWRITFGETTATDTDTDGDSGASYVVHSMALIILPLLMGILT